MPQEAYDYVELKFDCSRHVGAPAILEQSACLHSQYKNQRCYNIAEIDSGCKKTPIFNLYILQVYMFYM